MPPQAVIQFAEDGLYVFEVYATNLDIKSGRRKRGDNKNVTFGTLLEGE